MTGTWAERHGAAVVNAVDARARAEQAPADAAAQAARKKAEADLVLVERSMASEGLLLLRVAAKHAGPEVHRLLVAAVREVADGMLNEFRNELVEMAEAILRLEERRPPR